MHLMDDFTKTRHWRNFVSRMRHNPKDMPLEVLDYISILEDQIQELNKKCDCVLYTEYPTSDDKEEDEDGWEQQEKEER